MAACRKPELRCLSHSNHVVRQVTSSVIQHIDLLTGYPVRTENTKPSVTSHGPHFVQYVLCDLGLSIFQYGPGNQLINR